MNKRLVAILTNNDDDIYCFRKELIEALIANKYEVLVSCPYGEKFELMKDLEFRYDNPKIDRRGTSIPKDTKLLMHYKKLLKTYNPKVVLTYTAKPNVYGSLAAKSLHIPVINNLTGIGSVKNKAMPLRKFIIGLFKSAYRNSFCVMFQNETNMNMAIKTGMIKGAYELIPGSGVNTERYPLQEYPDGGDGITGEKIVFNYIGRILEDKGVEDYIAAAKRIRRKYPRTEFNMLGFIEPGEEHYDTDLKNLQNKDVLIYRGNQKDIIPYIKRAHATIHPSTYGEGMSNVLLESASCGRPIITTDNPGCKETVIKNKTGFIYESGNVDMLCESIERFLRMSNKERKRMGELGREYVKSKFSRQIVVDAYLEKIAQLV